MEEFDLMAVTLTETAASEVRRLIDGEKLGDDTCLRMAIGGGGLQRPAIRTGLRSGVRSGDRREVRSSRCVAGDEEEICVAPGRYDDRFPGRSDGTWVHDREPEPAEGWWMPWLWRALSGAFPVELNEAARLDWLGRAVFVSWEGSRFGFGARSGVGRAFQPLRGSPRRGRACPRRTEK